MVWGGDLRRAPWNVKRGMNYTSHKEVGFYPHRHMGVA